MSQFKNIRSSLKPMLASLAVLFLYSACSEQTFSSGADTKQSQESKKDKKPPVTMDNTKIPGGPGGPGGPNDPNGGLSTDDGGISGTPVSKVGIGFEDIGGSATDHNDAYICFTGSFSVDKKTYEIVSNKDQSNVIAVWGNLAAIVHNLNIKITDSSDKEVYNKTFQGRKHAPTVDTIPLSFTMGSKLVVTMDSRVKHSDVGPGAWSSQVELDQCNNTGN
jgi:hypothetical protein